MSVKHYSRMCDNWGLIAQFKKKWTWTWCIMHWADNGWTVRAHSPLFYSIFISNVNLIHLSYVLVISFIIYQMLLNINSFSWSMVFRFHVSSQNCCLDLFVLRGYLFNIYRSLLHPLLIPNILYWWWIEFRFIFCLLCFCVIFSWNKLYLNDFSIMKGGCSENQNTDSQVGVISCLSLVTCWLCGQAKLH